MDRKNVYSKGTIKHIVDLDTKDPNVWNHVTALGAQALKKTPAKGVLKSRRSEPRTSPSFVAELCPKPSPIPPIVRRRASMSDFEKRFMIFEKDTCVGDFREFVKKITVDSYNENAVELFQSYCGATSLEGVVQEHYEQIVKRKSMLYKAAWEESESAALTESFVRQRARMKPLISASWTRTEKPKTVSVVEPIPQAKFQHFSKFSKANVSELSAPCSSKHFTTQYTPSSASSSTQADDYSTIRDELAFAFERNFVAKQELNFDDEESEEEDTTSSFRYDWDIQRDAARSYQHSVKLEDPFDDEPLVRKRSPYNAASAPFYGGLKRRRRDE